MLLHIVLHHTDEPLCIARFYFLSRGRGSRKQRIFNFLNQRCITRSPSMSCPIAIVTLITPMEAL